VIGGLPPGIGHDIMVIALIWLGAIIVTAMAALLLAVVAWRSPPGRKGVYGVGAIVSAVLSVGLLLWLLETVS
jgi:hypothetical protein